MTVRLSSPENAAIAVFHNPKGFCIVAGNIMEGEVPDVNAFLHDEAAGYFGAVIESGSAKGSRPGRWDCWVVVDGLPDRVMSFVRDRLGGGDNQMTAH